MKLNVKAAAYAGAIIWGLGVFLVTWWMIILEGGNSAPIFLSRIYPGYTITPLGSLLGLVYGGIDGAVFLGSGAWVYNRIQNTSS